MNKIRFIEREANGQVQRLAVSDLATIYGCCGLFDMCADGDLMSLSFAGAEPLLDIIGWTPSDVCRIRKGFITYMRPEQVEDLCTPGWVADPCADPHGVEYGVCEFELEDFGRLRREGPVRDITKATLRLCENQPRYRLDGRPITDDVEFGIRLATEVLMQDLKRMVITGNAATAGQFDGLQQLIRTGYTDPSGKRCTSMDSIIVDWNSNAMSGGYGMTWNGREIDHAFDVVDVLLAIYRHIRQDLGYAQALGNNLQVGDIVLAMPTFLIRCLLDSYTCWSVCTSENWAWEWLNTIEGRKFRDGLNGGMFGAGRIYLDGFEIPLVPYDWGTILGPTRGDIYFLTVKVGNQRLIEGQFNDMRNVLSLPGLGAAATLAQATDGGRLLIWPNTDQTCVKHLVEMQPRILSWAPWAQARIEDVRCAGPGLPKSPDPCETSFFPEGSMTPAECGSTVGRQ